jgi:acetylornithine deacetylase
LFEVDVPTMNLGHIHGGDNPNRICGECELQIDLRVLPGMDVSSLRGSLNQRVADILADSGLTYEIRSLTEAVPPMFTAANSPIVTETERLSNKKAGSVAFATEGPFLDLMGIETIVMGAGDIDQAHQPDEYVALDRLEPMIDILKNLIFEFCMDEQL